jgi:hypothetical protein
MNELKLFVTSCISLVTTVRGGYRAVHLVPGELPAK